MNLTPEERSSLETGAFADAVRAEVRYGSGKPFEHATTRDLLSAVSVVCRNWAVDRMLETEDRIRDQGAKRLYYLSLEFLLGRSLESTLRNLMAIDEVRKELGELGCDLETLILSERDAGLGNGGLGRLAACFMDSLATRDYAGFGYGINYEYGLFRQIINQNEQHERPDAWRRLGSPWLIARPERTVAVPVYGHVTKNGHGPARARWVDWSMIFGVPHDMPVVGYGGRTVNWLRLYSAETSAEFDVSLFNSGDYLHAFERKLATERISKLLYPSNESEAGKELRLLQEYFFSACAVRDIMRRFFEDGGEVDEIPEAMAIQLNDTHPSLAVPELIRLLVDERDVELDHAIEITRATTSYTNHTLLPEALERYPKPLLERVVPRHLQFIELLNDRMLKGVRQRFPDDVSRLQNMSVFEESFPQRVRMANLAIAGSHHVNGVSQLHTDLVKSRLVPDFVEYGETQFVNVTNGVSPRRWLAQANPGLAELLSRHIGTRWIDHLDELERIEPLLEDPEFLEEFRQIKRANKQRLAHVVNESCGVALDPDSLFDVQVKRIHLYKRQLLAALHAIHLYLRIVEDGDDLVTPRTCLFAGKAAPSYFHAKLTIRLLSSIGAVAAADPRVSEQLRIVFVPDYRVSLAEVIIPAADVSEQISTAGFEASGTGNMKMALNGALTIGTLDGANIEIRDAVGPENIYIFGLQAEEVAMARLDYDPHTYVAQNPVLARVIDALTDDRFSLDAPGVFTPLLRHLFDDRDPYCVLADFDSYLETQSRVAAGYRDPHDWNRRAGLNVARMGRFSSDRSIQEYAQKIWGLQRLET